ncbi:MAG: DUF6931 family protein [Pseudomonadales bacterium]
MSYKKIPFDSSESLWRRFDPSQDVLDTLALTLSPEQTIAQLYDAQLYIDMANFIAHALPMRESIWWCATALELRWDHWGELERDTLLHCKNWVLEPEEAKRRLIEQRVGQLGHKCAMGWLAQAVVWNGSGSIGAPEQPEVLPAPYLFAKAVGGAINTSALVPQWQGYAEFYRDVRDIAEDIARGGRGQKRTAEALS